MPVPSARPSETKYRGKPEIQIRFQLTTSATQKNRPPPLPSRVQLTIWAIEPNHEVFRPFFLPLVGIFLSRLGGNSNSVPFPLTDSTKKKKEPILSTLNLNIFFRNKDVTRTRVRALYPQFSCMFFFVMVRGKKLSFRIQWTTLEERKFNRFFCSSLVISYFWRRFTFRAPKKMTS